MKDESLSLGKFALCCRDISQAADQVGLPELGLQLARSFLVEQGPFGVPKMKTEFKLMMKCDMTNAIGAASVPRVLTAKPT